MPHPAAGPRRTRDDERLGPGVHRDEVLFALSLSGTNAPLDLERLRREADETIAERLAGRRTPDVRVEREVVPDRPDRALRRCTPTGQLVVGGAFRGLALGSTSQNLLHHAPVPGRGGPHRDVRLNQGERSCAHETS